MKMVDGRTTDGRTTEHGYTISSPMSLKTQVLANKEHFRGAGFLTLSIYFYVSYAS